MKILKNSSRTVSRLLATSIKSEPWSVRQANFSSNIIPVKLAVAIFESNATDTNAPPLIVLHGLFGSKQNFRALGKALAESTKRKVYTVDARNHGESPRAPEHNSPHMAADIVHLMQEEGLQRVSVMGHSMGGRVMMFFALKYRDMLDKAIIMDVSPVSIPHNFDFMKSVLKAMKDIKIPPHLSSAEGRAVAKRQLNEVLNYAGIVELVIMCLKKTETGEFVWAVNVDAVLANFSNLGDTQQFRMPPYPGPMLFIKGNHSEFLRMEDWPQIKEIFPNAELEVIEAGHVVHFDQPERCLDLVTKFLSR